MEGDPDRIISFAHSITPKAESRIKSLSYPLEVNFIDVTFSYGTQTPPAVQQNKKNG